MPACQRAAWITRTIWKRKPLQGPARHSRCAVQPQHAHAENNHGRRGGLKMPPLDAEIDRPRPPVGNCWDGPAGVDQSSAWQKLVPLVVPPWCSTCAGQVEALSTLDGSGAPARSKDRCCVEAAPCIRSGVSPLPFGRACAAGTFPSERNRAASASRARVCPRRSLPERDRPHAVAREHISAGADGGSRLERRCWPA